MNSVDLIERTGPNQYRVSLRVADVVYTFAFVADRGGTVDVVTWDSRFDRAMQGTRGGLRPILAAVLAFHQSQDCSVELAEFKFD